MTGEIVRDKASTDVVTNGRITTKSGMSYRLLGLDPYSQHMSLPVLPAIHKLVEDGAVVAGPKPTDDPSLADDQSEFHQLNDELFGDGTGVRNVGKGTVFAGQSLADVFSALKVAPDFDYTKPESDTRLLFLHRKVPPAEVIRRRFETNSLWARLFDRLGDIWNGQAVSGRGARDWREGCC